ncbi:MAG: hypothetical protein A2W99_04020 [Bacteroidetes bacterium GWF2_33_16]|nr:MAG: hypothetical protein A2X00_07235 [Bacteroidetes bacterium GWE2_32_14]OFY02959.1 MAG: hypothetical protein A2W99_04020 [Bacteroidetes bacterium GWF2_33_16]
MKKLLLLFFVFIIIITNNINAQTTLAAGDIAFIGLNSDYNAGGVGFAFVFLKDVSSGTTFNITDNGWIDASSSFRAEGGDATLVWTATGSVSAGTIVQVYTTNGTNGASITPTTTVGSISSITFTLAAIGDQLFIYQGLATSPVFIAGIHFNVEPTSSTSNWDNAASVSLYNTTSDLPDQLTNGINAIWVYDAGPTERDNFRYKSTALTTGSTAELCAAINTLSNWDVDATNATAYTLNPFPCSFTVIAGNNKPTASSFTASPIYEGTPYAFSTANFGYSDSDSDPLNHIRITAVPNTGTLWIDADADGIIDGTENTITNGETVTKVELDAGKFKYINTSGSSSSFTFDVNDGTDYSASTYTATLTVTPQPTVTLSLDPTSSISENGGTTNVKATLSHTFNKTVTVNLVFSGTASGSDYSVTASLISITSGNTNNTVSITGQDDALDENNETVIVDISSVTNGSESGTQQVTCTLTDDDATPTVTFTTESQLSVNETSTMTITAQLSAISGRDVTVPFTINGSSTATGAGTDYSITSSPLTITTGNTTANITITIATDYLDENNETIIVDMGAPTNATQGTTTSHTATITDDDNTPTVTFTAASQSSANETGTLTITAQLSAASGKNVTVPFTINGSSTATGSGTDYSITGSPLNITAGNTIAEITITITSDVLDENNETVIVDMGTPTNATQGATTSHTATITDDDDVATVTFTSASQSSADETGTMNITAQLSAASGKNVTVPFSVRGSSTAIGGGTDYSITAGPLSITAGNTSADITITITSDVLYENNETVIVDMGTPVNATQGATTSHTATISDDDATPTVTFTSASQLSADETGTMTITAQLSAISGRDVIFPFTINGSSTATGAGTDYSITGSPLNITAGNTSADIIITIATDVIDENNESVIVDMGTPTNATQGATTSHTATITDDDATPTVAFNTTSSNGLESISSADLQVDLSAISGLNVTVDYAVTGTATGSGTDYTLANGTLAINAGDANNDITIASIVNDLLDENNETVIVTLTNPTNAVLGANTIHTYTIIDDDDVPTITTQTVTNTTSTSVTANGNIIYLGIPNPTQHGFCYNETGSPSLSDSHVDMGAVSSTGAFSTTINFLDPNTTYYLKAYATNTAGTSYGDEVSFTTLAEAPTVITNAATNISGSEATLNGTVNAENASTVVSFEYGLTTAYGSSAVADQSPVLGVANTDVSTVLTELEPNTTYHYRVVGVNAGGTTYGSDQSFITDAIAPTVTTLAATDVTAKGITFHGIVNANNASTIVTIEMGTTTAYGIISGVEQSPVTGSSDVIINYGSYGYTPNTTYHYRVVGVNAGGTTYGEDVTVTTLTQKPLATTVDASSIGTTSVRLNGSVNANELSTDVTFEYGLTTSYGTSVAAFPSPLSAGWDEGVNKTITGLIPNTAYHYRVVAVNSEGTAYGDDLTFTTATIDPTLYTDYATDVSVNSATLNGFVNPNDYSTTVTFEYGLTAAYGSTITADQSPVTGNTEQDVSADISGLSPYTTYHFRVVGESIAGSANGYDLTFTTSSAAATITSQAVTAINETTATANGIIIDLGAPNPTAHGVCWNTSGTPTTNDNVTDEGAVSATGAFTSNISELIPNTTYYVRAYATNTAGTAYGDDVSFTTLAKAPAVITNTVTSISVSGATLNGTVNANNSETVVTFEYGLSTAYGTTITANENPVDGLFDTPVSKEIAGLKPNTTYHYRVVGVNSAGTTNGDDQTFTTIKHDQVITFDTLPDKTTTDVDFNPGATSDQGLIISYTSSNELVATIVSNLIHIVGAGTAEITALQEGNDTVNTAATVSQILTVTEATGIEYIGLEKLTTYPNPVKDVLNIEIGDGLISDHVSISIIDVTGKTVFSENYKDAGLKVDVSNLNPGLYFITIKTSINSRSLKVIKE